MPDKAPDFELVSLAGGTRKLSELLAGGPVLLAFYKVTCPTCQLTFPFLQRLQAATDELQVVGISQDPAAASQEFNRRNGVTFTTLLDPADDGTSRFPASNAYRITNVPTAFLVEPDGTVSQTIAGFHKAELEQLAARFGVEIFTPGDRVPVFRPG